MGKISYWDFFLLNSLEQWLLYFTLYTTRKKPNGSIIFIYTENIKFCFDFENIFFSLTLINTPSFLLCSYFTFIVFEVLLLRLVWSNICYISGSIWKIPIAHMETEFFSWHFHCLLIFKVLLLSVLCFIFGLSQLLPFSAHKISLPKSAI